ncbi:MAG: PspC domain-containing protein [Peptococcaceae bacterium]|nr:PspC domain-containing protein [Peptococcaceae bacterium]
MANQIKRFSRSKSNRMIAGVCGGIAEYFGLDYSLVRVIYVIISVFSAAFPGIIIYLAAWIIMPDEFE